MITDLKMVRTKKYYLNNRVNFMTNQDQYCTVLNVINVINTNILGFTFWGTSVEFMGNDDQKSAGIIYFLTKAEALNFEIGDRFLK